MAEKLSYRGKGLEIHEILDKISEAKSSAAKVKAWKEYDSDALRQIVQLAFHPGVEWYFEPGPPPPYKPANEHQHPSSFRRNEYRGMGRFCKGSGYDSLSSLKREMAFIQMLEGIHPKDAEIICSFLAGTFEELYPGVTKNSAEKAFPEIFDY